MTALPQFEANLDLLVNNLALAGAHPYLKPLADVNLDSGALNVDASVSSSPAEPLHFEGSVAIADFLITETDEGSRLGSWESLSADRLVFSAAQSALEVSEVRVLRPYGDILIAEDGSVNLGRVQKEEPVVEATNEPEADESPDSSGIDITVGRILVEDGAADFEDRSLPLPFSVKIGELAGDLTTIATSSSEPSAVNLEGKVDEFGRVVIGGTVTPMDPSANTDLHVVFENIEMPKFSAYSIPFAGREIASGRLDLDLGYKVSNGELDGANKVVLRDFELGDSVEHPGALSLPLGLAVALLKDPDGRINIDVPVRGNVDDPEFKYGSVIAKALANLITRIVTSPFALLANLVGAEASELEYIAFEPGSPELAPPEVEKAVKIAEALSLRPGLVLGVHGVYAQELDAAALRAARFDATVESRMAAVGDDGAMFAERRREVIESLYIESGIGVEPSLALEAVRSEYTSQATDDTPETFDALAYTEALRRELIDLQPLVEADLLTLAAERASAVRQAIIAADPASAPRLAMGESEAVAAVDASIIQMQVELTISASGAQSSSGDGLPAGPISFSCDEGMTLTIGFDGPETLNLDDGIGTHVLSRVPSASGGRYVAGEIEFWEKGDSAVYVGAAGRYECAREGER